MNYIIESILVGLYTGLIYMLFVPFIKNLYFLLLVVGFCKHFFGFIFGIHTWYCNNGEACKKVLNKNENYIANSLYLILDSIYESLIFLFLGSILSYKLTKFYLFFTIGLILHISAEKMQVHKMFCKKTCNIIKPN